MNFASKNPKLNPCLKQLDFYCALHNDQLELLLRCQQTDRNTDAIETINATMYWSVNVRT